ncbi:hypothetical protein [Streptomyces sp. NPDC002463]|uniref:hypothetical protein n=1 Tax=Streptomyces sp. NPDC002463 TaxID=3364645 RepID=UPI0036A8EDA1
MTQWLAERAKARELDQSARQRAEERQYETKRALAEAVRTCYGRLNTASLDYQSELNHFWHALRAGRVTDDVRSRLDDARREHRARYSEAQMRVPDDVLTVVDGAHREIGTVRRRAGTLSGKRRQTISVTHLPADSGRR